MTRTVASARAQRFRYAGLDIDDDTLTGHFELDGRRFKETVTFEGVDSLHTPAVRAVASLWYLVAGLSYYKAGAAHEIDLADTPVGPRGRALFEAALRDGLGEFSYRNDLALDDVTVQGGVDVSTYAPDLDPRRVLTPFGGGIDSVVTLTQLLGHVDQSLFIVSPPSGRFLPLENTAAVSTLPVVRATRSLDEQLLDDDETWWHGHVPVTAMITLLAAVAAVASGRGGVAMSNEHSASAPNLRWRERDVNHQWSKSWVAEELISAALSEVVGPDLVVASVLRDRSELWVAQQFAQLTAYHHVFRSCNRAFAQKRDDRAPTWCGECDKCLFIDLILAPFLSRSALRSIFDAEPLARADLGDALRTLVGVGLDHKPFECVGDPDESAVALMRVSSLDEWSDVSTLRDLALLVQPERTFDELLAPLGPSRAPARWLR